MSQEGNPLFSCAYQLSADSSTRKEYTAKNATCATRECLQSLGIFGKKRSGVEFFGLKRGDVLDAIRECGDDTIDINISEIETVAKNDEPALPNVFKKSTISWVGVRDFGRPVTDARYNRVLDAKTNSKYRLHIGYTSVRKVTPADGDPVFVFCKVLEGDHGPVYRCSTDANDDDLDLDLDPCFEVATHAVKHIFKTLGVKVKHNYSGHEFFGFNYSDVLAKLCCPIQDYRAGPSGVLNLQQYPELQRLVNIKIRGAGTTDSLSCKASKERRNEAIHDAVKLGSFGDITSKFDNV